MEMSESPPPGRLARRLAGVFTQEAPPSVERKTGLGEPGRLESRPDGPVTYIVPSVATSMPGSLTSRPVTTTGLPNVGVAPADGAVVTATRARPLPAITRVTMAVIFDRSAQRGMVGSFVVF